MNDKQSRTEGASTWYEDHGPVTRKSYRINLPVIGWTEWKVYTPDSFLDDMAWLATNSHNYTVVFKD